MVGGILFCAVNRAIAVEVPCIHVWRCSTGRGIIERRIRAEAHLCGCEIGCRVLIYLHCGIIGTHEAVVIGNRQSDRVCAIFSIVVICRLSAAGVSITKVPVP